MGKPRKGYSKEKTATQEGYRAESETQKVAEEGTIISGYDMERQNYPKLAGLGLGQGDLESGLQDVILSFLLQLISPGYK